MARSVSHVSRRWRAVAVSCQYLWSHALPCGSLEWTRLCLSRCFSAPFELAISGLSLDENEEYRLAYDLVLPHLARVRGIAFQLDEERGLKNSHVPGILRDLLEKISTTVMPDAKELVIYYSDQYGTLEGIPGLHFSTAMPALDEIFLRGIVCTPSAGPQMFPPSLRELCLTDSNFWWSVDEMIDTLRCVPMLETLEHTTNPITFTHGLAPVPSQVHPLRCVNLEKLELLTCSCGSFARNMLFFSYLSFPPAATLRIEYPHSHPLWILDAHSSSPTEVEDIQPLGESAIREHFAGAISQGALFPDVFLDGASVSSRGPGAPDAYRWPVLPFGTSARHLLPPFIKLDVPEVGNEFRSHQADSQAPRPFHERLFESWVSLPFFANTSTLHLRSGFDNFSLAFLRRFTLVREVHFASLYMLGSPFTIMVLDDQPNFAEGLFPMLTTIHVGCTGDNARQTETSKDDLTRFERLADVILLLWGSTLERLVLHEPELLVSRVETLALLQRRLGVNRVICDDSETSTPYCSCYTAPAICDACRLRLMHAEEHEHGEEDSGDGSDEEDSSGDDEED
ncbi:unnamed protein product [Peniophora sp. CBMAI 1063]|nr:unnamed protein product [Peniophora sp. CBMAI 1063]